VVDKVEPGLLRIIWFSAVSTIPPIFHTHISFAYSRRCTPYNLDNWERRRTQEYYLFVYFECSYAARTFADLCTYAARLIRSQCRTSKEFYIPSVGIVRDTVTGADLRNSGTRQHIGVCG
jgi:hypothetical protein